MPPTEEPPRHDIEQPAHVGQPVEPTGSAAIKPLEQQVMQLDEVGLGSGEDDQEIVGRIAKQFAALAPGADMAMFGSRVETALEWVKAEVPRALLHYLAAEALANAGGIDRALNYVERARSTLLAVGPAAPAEVSGRIAMLRARLLLSSGEDVATSIEASEQAMALVPPEESPDVMGAIAYNAGLRLLGLEPSPDALAFLRAEALFRRALEGYETAGMSEQASDAAEKLAALALQRLERGAPGTAKDEIFVEAWRLAERAMALSGSTASPATWARRNELAARILSLRPSTSAEANARDAINYLARALDRYQTGAADAVAAARCADMILSLMDVLPRPWSSDIANRYVIYLGVKAGHSNTPVARAAQALAAAGAWARVADDPAARARHLHEYADQALAAATEAGDDALSASALILSGNAHMETLQPEKGNSSHLAEASALFEKAVTSARKCRDVVLEAQALRQLGVALARRVGEHDEIALLDRTVEVLREAADKSQGGERARVLVNLSSLQLWAARRQEQAVPVDMVQRTIDEAEPLAAMDATAAQGLARLRQDLLEAIVLDGLSPAQFASPPASLGYRRYRTEERTLGDADAVARVITLVLVSDQVAPKDGVMKLSESGGEVAAEIEIACPACGAKKQITSPVITSLEGNAPPAFDNARRMARGELRCTSCATPIMVQSYFALEGGVRGGHSIVYPDVLGAGPSGILSHQVGVIGQLHQAFLGKPLEATTLLPWGGILAFGTLDAATTFSVQRTLNLGAVVFGLLTGQIEKLRTGLEGCLHSIGSHDPVSAEEVLTALNALATASGGPAPDPGFAVGLAAQITRLISELRTQGLDVVMTRLSNARAEMTATEAEIEAAMRTAANPDTRRAMLRRYLEEAPDYSSDREQAIYDLFLHGPELEMKALLEKGISESDPRVAGASALLAGARKSASEKIAEDREKNSAVPGKALLTEALRGGRPFVLLLRAFAVDVPIGRPSQVIRKMTEDFSDALTGWRVYALARLRGLAGFRDARP